MLHATAEQIETRATEVAERLIAGGWQAALISGASAVGGGSAPGVGLPTVLIAIEREGTSTTSLEKWLRTLTPPIIARIEGDLVVLDLRTVPEEQDELLLSILL